MLPRALVALVLSLAGLTPESPQDRPEPAVVIDDTPPKREAPKPAPKLTPQKPPPKTAPSFRREVSAITDTLLACIRSFEQGADGYATDTGNGYFGAYQFSADLWRAYFGERTPAEVSPAEQDAAAVAVLEHDGGLRSFRWPTPARNC